MISHLVKLCVPFISSQVFRPTMDQCLSRNYFRLKKNGIRPETWLKTCRGILAILVSIADFDAVQKAEGEWSIVSDEVTRLMESSVAARTIFSFCGQLLSASNYKAKIEQYLEALDTKGTTEASIAEFKTNAQSAATAFKA